ncbi:hypothetical protein DICPUDRAFT_156448 [Dictyostelium purpureum]|uniref:Uncharacterized protein n=1 Tax=Dictyostelium purpureum TaxID=5786 RepID=F0ZWL5_DICPU|nr:uncharacterized protein DICPUDRAFT_156448 [Dictyostelium purpureum]EGC31678.1 hypothetical protein DICPUDRAFT_156448 [Dictyostelium purpureum]|eukprot:XP_003291809.1 hypothetical protein DICPUDRAFT_156448 [Dictyostelium purpureum]
MDSRCVIVQSSSYDSSAGSSNSSSSNQESGDIFCRNEGNGLTVGSFTSVNCTVYSASKCVDNNNHIECTRNTNGIVTCVTPKSNSSISCYGTSIECTSSNVKCSIDSKGKMEVNDVPTTKTTVHFKDGKEIDENSSSEVINNVSSTSPSFLIFLSIILLQILKI